jgi:hypothetical protein
VKRSWPILLTVGKMTKKVHIQAPEKNAPPLDMEYFYNLVAETANDESLADGNYRLQYKMSDTATKAPWIGLETDEDAFACQETVVNGYINNKRKKAPWSLNIKMVTSESTKRRADSDVEEITGAAAGKTKKRKVSFITPNLCVENSVANKTKSLTAAEREEEKESEILPFAVKIQEANRCAQHPGNNLGCYITRTGNHVAITPSSLNIWATGLQRGIAGVTDRNPPPAHSFDNEAKKTRARTALKSRSRSPSTKSDAQATTSMPSPWPGYPQQPGAPNPWAMAPPIPPNPYMGFPPTYGGGPFFGGYPSVPNAGFAGYPPAVYGQGSAVPGTTSMGSGLNSGSSGSAFDLQRQELVALPLPIFLSRLEEIYPDHDFLTCQDKLELNGITPDLIAEMSDKELDSVLGDGSLGKRLILRRLLGKGSQ